MTIKQFIERAIEGGYTIPPNLLGDVIQESVYVDTTGTNPTTMVRPYNIHGVLLSPEAWQAVGKTEGWKKYVWTSWKGWDDSWITNETDDESYAPPSANAYCQRHITFVYHMHRMIDALASGKSLEEFIATL